MCGRAVPDLCAVDLVADNVLEVYGEGLAIDLGSAAGPADALGNIKDDACEAFLVDVDLLVVGDLADCAGVAAVLALCVLVFLLL